MNKNSNLSLQKIEVRYLTPKIMYINQEYIPNITVPFISGTLLRNMTFTYYSLCSTPKQNVVGLETNFNRVSKNK